MSLETFKEVKSISLPIWSGHEFITNAVLEGTLAVMDRLTSTEQVYVKYRVDLPC